MFTLELSSPTNTYTLSLHDALPIYRLGLFDGDHAVLADLLHGLGDQRADGRVVVGGDRGDLGDLLLALGGLGHVLQLLDRKSTRLNSSHRCISYAVFCLKKKKYIRI